MQKKLILITNDDGYKADGIVHLQKALDEITDTVVVAPHNEKSGSSHSLTLNKSLRVRKFKDNVFSVNGFPADCVHSAVNGILKREPSLIVSGINNGPNTGIDVYYSGTVAGARQGIIYGIERGFSVSLVADKNEKEYFWQDAANFSKKLAQKMLAEGYKGEGFLNVNYPNIPLKEIKGIKITRMFTPYYIQGTQNSGGKETDINAVMEGYISITPLILDLTDHKFNANLLTHHGKDLDLKNT